MFNIKRPSNTLKLLRGVTSLCSLVAWPALARAADFHVDPSGSDSFSCGPSIDPCQSLNQAIANAAAGDDIYLSAGTHVVQGVFVLQEVTVHGEGMDVTVLDAEELDRHLRIATAGATVTLADLTLENGLNPTGNGGSILVESGVLELEGVKLRDNHAPAGRGGAIELTGGSLIARDSRFNRNGAVYGGAIDCWQHIDADCEGVEIHASRLINNDATYGGAIESYGPLLITGSELARNAAGSQGGAVRIGSSGSLTLRESQVSDNQSSNGGAIHAEGPVTIRKSAVINNRAEICGGFIYGYAGVTIVNSTLALNGAGNCGGAIAGTDVELFFSTLVDNDSDIDNGEDLYGGTFTVEKTLITHPTNGVPPAWAGSVCNTAVLSVLDNVTDATDCGFVLSPPDDSSLAPISSYTFGDLPQFYAVTQQVNPAVDAASNCLGPRGGSLTEDQANNSRPFGTACDVGAYEYH